MSEWMKKDIKASSKGEAARKLRLYLKSKGLKQDSGVGIKIVERQKGLYRIYFKSKKRIRKN